MTVPDLTPVIAAVVGPTASGKSALALALAEVFAAELVSVDSMQVYRGMDVGTAKPRADELAAVRHHVIDVADPEEDYTLARFQGDAAAALADIQGRGRAAILVGGTGLYFQAAVDGFTIPGQFPAVRDALDEEPDTAVLHERLTALDPVAAGRMEPTNRRRIVRALEVTVGSGVPFSRFGPGLGAYPARPFPIVAIRHPRPELDRRIDARLDQQLQSGFLAEVEALRSRPVPMSRTARQALGYRELLEHLDGGAELPEAVALIRVRTRQFARRQERWFRRDPRVVWLDPVAPAVGPAGPDALVAAVAATIRSGTGGTTP